MSDTNIQNQISNLSNEYAEGLVEFSISAFNKFDASSPLASTSVSVRKADEEIKFSLDDGRVITLVQISQHLTQRNVYEGLQHPYASIADAVLTSQVLVGKLEHMPVVLTSEIYTGAFSSSPADAWLALPAVTTIAVFESESFVRDAEATSSILPLIWFQPNFGLSFEDGLVAQIKSLDWVDLANDCFL